MLIFGGVSNENRVVMDEGIWEVLPNELYMAFHEHLRDYSGYMYYNGGHDIRNWYNEDEFNKYRSLVKKHTDHNPVKVMLLWIIIKEYFATCVRDAEINCHGLILTSKDEYINEFLPQGYLEVTEKVESKSWPDYSLEVMKKVQEMSNTLSEQH